MPSVKLHVKNLEFNSVPAPYGFRGGNAPWFMCWFWHCVNCLFLCLLNFLPHFLLSSCFLSYLFTSLLVYFLTNISTPSKIDPFCFQAGGCRRRPNLALVYLCKNLCCSIFCYRCMFAFVVLSQEIGLEERLRNDLFCVKFDVKP